MVSAILAANFPTLVPPYFCTSHRAAGSIEFWCRPGGVASVAEADAEEDAPLDVVGEGVRESKRRLDMVGVNADMFEV